MIHIEQLQFAYSKKKPLFDQLELQLEAGKIYGLLGKNGTGKSTLLKLMAGLVFPKKGTVSLAARDNNQQVMSTKNRKAEILRDIFFLPEQFEFPPISPKTFVSMEAAFYPHFDHQLFNRLIIEFDLLESNKLNKLSHGQQKKFMIAFGLACQTRYLFLDEPTNGLDIPSKSQFRKVVASSLTEQQVIIISTHQIRDLDKLIDSIIVLDNGNIIFQSDIAAIEKKLSFVKGWDQPTGDDVLYVEKVLGGYISVQTNDSTQNENVELEILFNAIVENKEKIITSLK